MNEVLSQIEKTGIVPVVVLKNAKDAAPLAQSLLEGGLPCAEITFRTEAALESIKTIAEKFPQILLGAGTVLSAEQADRAMDSGAKFIVTPGLNPKVVEHCIKKGYTVCPGIMTPSELEQALSFGLDTVKFFPAENAGGIKMIKAISAPYPRVKFMPTGGINAANVREYLASDKILACGGSWMVKGDLISEGNFSEILRLTKEASLIAKEFRS
ncbi:MAG: bifunctional 4-hydroxy-2-oxoglutarate aldolase/2-dehydro-3-deoxy-phosphogluconate aldolase [Treponema sp.]|nr:bifunctional 4-hydroxy-2-oxoglutarate aldolase/2-dehydro-3-deoxy-phosphogluconate aldolase [Treponema sp.]MBQ1591404.1 bifunctional 4-hydroxy-2-oxoglutarate aldolase/2-dehydro-3-deoxy-phosphogluconate aldolase [Treponema sp.]MBQ1869923.1 bifunctional 4-hydroxy-2-oxoglutarate aldolase/2-dehydro-3-deoxy-phosphogluconate aldolase [Treponema sp.]MBQ2356968.1 bifunctional 4-hydroxy-2-oxoglutarate aldolase/2-dehydro-3-deoxy-phosphogluconate aldolase [Treponema sp.]MBQ2548978.1 bifunctional 4-hydro